MWRSNFIGAYVPYSLGSSAFSSLLGDQLDLHPLVVLIATVAGGPVAGMVGLILAAPLTAIGLNLYRELKGIGFFD